MKVGPILIALTVAFLGGFFLKLKLEKPCVLPVAAKVVVEEKLTTRTVVKTVRPDGTTIVKEVDTNRSQSKNSVKTVSVPLSQYRLGVKTHSGLDFKPSVEATAGYRLGNSTWLESGYNIQRKELSLGVSVEF